MTPWHKTKRIISLICFALIPQTAQAETAKQTLHEIFSLPDPPHVPDTLVLPTTRQGKIIPPTIHGIYIDSVPIFPKTTVKSVDPWNRPVILRSDTSTDSRIRTPVRLWVVDSKVLPYGTTLQGYAVTVNTPKFETKITWILMTLPTGRIIMLDTKKPAMNKNTPGEATRALNQSRRF